MENQNQNQKHQSLKRNDAYILALGFLQVFLFVRFLNFAQQIFYMMSLKKFIMYVFGGIAIFSVMLLFSNLGSLVQAYEDKNEETQSKIISRVGKTTVTILMFLLLLMFGSQVRF